MVLPFWARFYLRRRGFTLVVVVFRLYTWFALVGVVLLCGRGFISVGVDLPLSAWFYLRMRGFSSVGVVLPLWAWFYL